MYFINETLFFYYILTSLNLWWAQSTLGISTQRYSLKICLNGSQDRKHIVTQAVGFSCHRFLLPQVSLVETLINLWSSARNLGISRGSILKDGRDPEILPEGTLFVSG